MNPHDMHARRKQSLAGYADPDDAWWVFMTTFARKHKIKEHYIDTIGEMSNSMRILV